MTTAATAAAPAGGWCSFLANPAPGWGRNIKAGSVLYAQDVDLIVDYLGHKLWEGLGDVQRINPLAQTMVNNTLTAARTYLTGLVAAGATCDSIPNNPTDWPGVKQPDSVGDVFHILLDWTGLGDLAIKAGVLIAILALLLMAIRRLLT